MGIFLGGADHVSMAHYNSCVASQGRFLMMFGVLAARRLSSVAQRRGLIVVWVGHGANMHHPPNGAVSQDNGFKYL